MFFAKFTASFAWRAGSSDVGQALQQPFELVLVPTFVALSKEGMYAPPVRTKRPRKKISVAGCA
jgi:hypothetical protein